MKIQELYEFIASLETQALKPNKLKFISEPFTREKHAFFKKSGITELSTGFNFFIGNYGVLPENYSEAAYNQLSTKERAITSFYELFNNRIINLFYQCHKISLIDQLDDNFPDKNLISLLNFQTGPYYAPLFSFRLRSKKALEKLIHSYFGIICHKIITKTLEIKIHPHQACKLSSKFHFNELGTHCVLGSKTASLNQQLIITLEAHEFNQAGFIDAIHDLIANYTLNDTFFRLKFISSKQLLSSTKPIYLGWTSWL